MFDEHGTKYEAENMVIEMRRMNEEFRERNPSFIDCKIIHEAIRY